MTTHLQRMALCASLAVTVTALGVTGCSSKLETGYEPRKLNASNEKRRAFYAAPFTPEARAGASDDDRNDDPRYRKAGY